MYTYKITYRWPSKDNHLENDEDYCEIVVDEPLLLNRDSKLIEKVLISMGCNENVFVYAANFVLAEFDTPKLPKIMSVDLMKLKLNNELEGSGSAGMRNPNKVK